MMKMRRAIVKQADIQKPNEFESETTTRRGYRAWVGWGNTTLVLVMSLLFMAGCPPMTADDDTDDHDDEGGGEVVLGDITTIAGTGVAAFGGDGGPASAAQLNQPMKVLVRPTGEMIVVDFENHRVRSIDAETGVITTLAGTGAQIGEGALRHPTGIVFAEDGSFFVAAWEEHRVYHYATDGSRTVAAGTGAPHCTSNMTGTQAPSATLCFPVDVGLMGDGTLAFTEQGCHRVRHVTGDGTLTSLAGTGAAGYAGDGGPAISATFNSSTGVTEPGFGLAFSPENPPDELYVADTENHVIRQINLITGTIETFAGTGTAGFTDGPLDQATFNLPTFVFAGHDHSIWVVDGGNHAIRRIDPLGTRVETIAGTGSPGFNGDNMPANEAQLNNPGGIFVTEEGDVYIADTGNNRIRRITAEQVSGTASADDTQE